MTNGIVRIGIGGWTYAPWRGVFYPEGLAHRRELEFAAATFGAIEINATLYGRQSPASWAKWAAAVPEGFQFAIKGSRYCVTRPRLADAGVGRGRRRLPVPDQRRKGESAGSGDGAAGTAPHMKKAPREGDSRRAVFLCCSAVTRRRCGAPGGRGRCGR